MVKRVQIIPITLESPGRTSSGIRDMNKAKTDIHVRNHYVMRSGKLKRSHGNVHI